MCGTDNPPRERAEAQGAKAWRCSRGATRCRSAWVRSPAPRCWERQPAGADRGQGRGAAEVRARVRRRVAGPAPVQVRPGRRDAVPREQQEVHRADRRPGHRHQRELGGPAARRRRPRPRSAAAPTSSTPGPTTRTSSRPSASTSPTSPTISARSMAAGGRSSRSTARTRRPASGSRCRSAAPATASSTASPGSTRPATTTIPSDLDGFLDMAQQAQGQRPPDRLRAGQRAPATPIPGATG